MDDHCSSLNRGGGALTNPCLCASVGLAPCGRGQLDVIHTWLGYEDTLMVSCRCVVDTYRF